MKAQKRAKKRIDGWTCFVRESVLPFFHLFFFFQLSFYSFVAEQWIMRYEKKIKNIYPKSEHLSKYSSHIVNSPVVQPSLQWETQQGNTLQGRATRKKKNIQERTKEVGEIQKTPPNLKRKKIIVFLSHPKGWKHLRFLGGGLTVVHWKCWRGWGASPNAWAAFSRHNRGCIARL